jgi:hypothetical protein
MAGRIALSLLLAMAIVLAPAGLSARPCVLINAPSEKACQPACCANKTCCETSPKNTSAPSQPLLKSGSAAKVNAASAATLISILPSRKTDAEQFSHFIASCYAHAPPTLALICIRLI